MRRFAFLLGLLLAICLAAPVAAKPKRPAPPVTPLILISIDGFRPDYLDRDITPTLSALAAGGVRAGMRPSYPSLTFPNHYTIVTGLRPDHHGLVDNTFEDLAIADTAFSMSDPKKVTDRRWWDGGEPLWVTAQNQGLRTATMFWPGSEAPIHGVMPDQWLPFDYKMKSAARVDRFLAWLDGPRARWPKFMTLYFDAVDTEGHHHGPGSIEVDAAIAEVDAAMARLLAGLKARGLARPNIIVVADHGMANVSLAQTLYLEDLLPAGAYRPVATGSGASIIPAPGHEAEVEKVLLGRREHFTCWRKGEMPARYHYGRNPRVPPIVCLAETGWALTTRAKVAARTSPYEGAHGFDPYALEMRAVFVANGPAFRAGAELPAFDNVDVYPLMAKVLGVKPRPGDGSLRIVSAALK